MLNNIERYEKYVIKRDIFRQNLIGTRELKWYTVYNTW